MCALEDLVPEDILRLICLRVVNLAEVHLVGALWVPARKAVLVLVDHVHVAHRREPFSVHAHLGQLLEPFRHEGVVQLVQLGYQASFYLVEALKVHILAV